MTAKARYKQKLVTEGRCVSCTKPNDRLPLRLCTGCAARTYTDTRRARNRLDTRSRNHRQKAEGICIVCHERRGGRFLRCLSCRLTRQEKRAA